MVFAGLAHCLMIGARVAATQRELAQPRWPPQLPSGLMDLCHRTWRRSSKARRRVREAEGGRTNPSCPAVAPEVPSKLRPIVVSDLRKRSLAAEHATMLRLLPARAVVRSYSGERGGARIMRPSSGWEGSVASAVKTAMAAPPECPTMKTGRAGCAAR